MTSLNYDLPYMKAGLGIFDKYLLSDELFWSLNENPPKGEPEYPSLTLGGILLAKARIVSRPKTNTEEAEVERVISELENIRTQWRVVWEKKAQHSFSVRLRMWCDFIDEYKNHPQENSDRYAYEVRLRTMMTLLKLEGGGQKQKEIELLSSLDGYLHKVLKMDGFIWEAEIQPGFPVGEYWYLYGNLPSITNKT